MNSNEGPGSKKKLWGLVTFRSTIIDKTKNQDAETLIQMEDIFNLAIQEMTLKSILDKMNHEKIYNKITHDKTKHKIEKDIHKIEEEISKLKKHDNKEPGR